MKSFNEFCAHYEYDPKLWESRALYEKYMEELSFFNAMLKRNKEEIGANHEQ